MYKCVIFDLDGTLADTISTITFYGNRTLAHFGLPEIDKEKYKYFVGNGYKVLAKRMIKEVGASEEIFPELSEYYHYLYETDSLYLTEVYDGISELIENLKKSGIKIGVLSNKPYGSVLDVCKALFPENTFDMMLGYSEGFLLKPNPEMLNKMLEDFGVSKEECLYIGDTSIDMETAQNAEVFAIGVLWGFRDEAELKESGAKLIVEKPQEIFEYIAKQNKGI